MAFLSLKSVIFRFKTKGVGDIGFVHIGVTLEGDDIMQGKALVLQQDSKVRDLYIYLTCFRTSKAWTLLAVLMSLGSSISLCCSWQSLT